MDEITNRLIEMGTAKIPQNVESEIERMIGQRLENSQHYKDFLKNI